MSTGDHPFPYQHWLAASMGYYWPTRGTYQTNPEPEGEWRWTPPRFIQCDYCQTAHVLAHLVVLTCHGCGAPLPMPLRPSLRHHDVAQDQDYEHIWDTARERYERAIDELMATARVPA